MIYRLLVFFDYYSAVREGFEPSVQFPVRQFSKLILSASQAPHLFTFKAAMLFLGVQI